MIAVSTIAARDFKTRTVKSFVTRPDGKGLTAFREV